MDTCEVLKNIRAKYNMIQDDMTNKLFVTRQAVSCRENGETIPNLER